MKTKTKTKLLNKQTPRITSKVCSLSAEFQRESFKQNYFKIKIAVVLSKVLCQNLIVLSVLC